MGSRLVRWDYYWRVACLSVIGWGGFALVASLFDPRWPTSFAENNPGESAWVGLALVVFIVHALSIKIVTLWQGSRIRDRLGAGVLIANVGFWIVYASTILLSFWPALGRSEWVRRALLAEVVLTVSYGTYEILRFRASIAPPRPRLTRALSAGAGLTVAGVLWRFGWLG